MRASERRRMERLQAELEALESEATGKAKQRIGAVEVRHIGPDRYVVEGVECTEAEKDAKIAELHAAFKRTTVHPDSLFIEILCPEWSSDQGEDE